MWLFGQRPDHQKDAVDGEITPLGRAIHLDVVGGDDLDHSGHLDEGLAAANGHLLARRLELRESGFESFGCRFSRAPALSRWDKADQNRVEFGIKNLGRRFEAQVVGSNCHQLSDPFLSGVAQSDFLAVMHGCGGNVTEGGLPPSLQLHQALDLLGFASEIRSYPAPELLGEAVELFRQPCHCFRVLVTAGGRDRKVRQLSRGWGKREAG